MKRACCEIAFWTGHATFLILKTVSDILWNAALKVHAKNHGIIKELEHIPNSL